MNEGLGLVFSELLVEILPGNKEFLKGIETSDLSYGNCLKNLDIVLKEVQGKLDPPEYIASFMASDLFEVAWGVSVFVNFY